MFAYYHLLSYGSHYITHVENGLNTRTFFALIVVNFIMKRKEVVSMNKTTIPGTKIIKVVAGKNNGDGQLRKDLEKIGKIELLGKTLKSIFSM